jgi:hypothetical protein
MCRGTAVIPITYHSTTLPTKTHISYSNTTVFHDISWKTLHICKNWISFIKFILCILPTKTKKSNQGFPEIWHSFTVPECPYSCRNAGFKRHDKGTHFCECDNEYLLNGSHFIWKYHKSSLSLLLPHQFQFVLVLMIVLALYIYWSV